MKGVKHMKLLMYSKKSMSSSEKVYYYIYRTFISHSQSSSYTIASNTIANTHTQQNLTNIQHKYIAHTQANTHQRLHTEKMKTSDSASLV